MHQHLIHSNPIHCLGGCIVSHCNAIVHYDNDSKQVSLLLWKSWKLYILLASFFMCLFSTEWICRSCMQHAAPWKFNHHQQQRRIILCYTFFFFFYFSLFLKLSKLHSSQLIGVITGESDWPWCPVLGTFLCRSLGYNEVYELLKLTTKAWTIFQLEYLLIYDGIEFFLSFVCED